MNFNFELYKPAAHKVSRALIASGSYKIELNPQNFFTWKSGIKAPVYTNCRELDKHPLEKEIIVSALIDSIRANFPSVEWIAGVSEAGTTWSAPIASLLGLPHSTIRKEEKQYGDPKDRVIISAPEEMTNVVMVDDLLASGCTMSDKIKVFEKETGIKPIGVQTIINWNFPKFRENFKNIGIKTCALVSYPQILEAAYEENLLSKEAIDELMKFYQNPKTHRWNLKALNQPANYERLVDYHENYQVIN